MANPNDRATEPGRHDSNAIKSPTDARQGRKFGRMRYVLIFGTLFAILAMIIVFVGAV